MNVPEECREYRETRLNVSARPIPIDKGTDRESMPQVMQPRSSAGGNLPYAGVHEEFLEYDVDRRLSKRCSVAGYKKVCRGPLPEKFIALPHVLAQFLGGAPVDGNQPGLSELAVADREDSS
jgi:hypothetical protein